MSPTLSNCRTMSLGNLSKPSEPEFFSFSRVDFLLSKSRFKVYLWDNRPESKTSGDFFSFEVAENSVMMIMIPPGVVHAYKNIGDIEAIIFNAPDRLYAGVNRKEPVDEIRYENNPDSKFKIND